MQPRTIFKKITHLGLAVVTATTLMASSTSAADVYWSASAVTAVPSFDFQGAVGIQTYYPPSFPSRVANHGRGVRHKYQQVGSVYLHIPVTAPFGSYFNWIRLRAEDNTPTGFVSASLFRQKLDTTGGAELLGSTTTGDVTSPSDGFQIVGHSLPALVTKEPGYSYYIELHLYRDLATSNVAAYDVELFYVWDN